MKFISFKVQRFRSLLDVDLNFSENTPTIICGENNIGKTNFLRALSIFFDHVDAPDLFNAKTDIPHHIFYGSRGAGAKTELTGRFVSEDGEKHNWKVIFRGDDDPSYKLNNKQTSVENFNKFVSSFRFLFIESNNVDIPFLISEVMDEDGLLPLDKKRAKQSRPLKKLEEFISLSQSALIDIEKKLNDSFQGLTDFDGTLSNKKVQIKFAEFDKLRDVLRGMTSVTLFDGNDHHVASKGSGAQRAVLLALMQYIAQNTKKKIVWGIDEPEAFLHPKLQQQVAKSFEAITSNSDQPMIVTTHSQYFIKLQDFQNVHLFKGNSSEKKYKRRSGEIFYELDTKPIVFSSHSEKALSIKEELGIQTNDGWSVLPQNIMVEGEDDKRYINAMIEAMGLKTPNIISCNGADNVKAYLQYHNSQADELSFRPSFKCVFDNDDKGRKAKAALADKKYDNLDVSILELPRYDGEVVNKKGVDWEFEDFVPPELIFQAVNKILKKHGYSIMLKSTLDDRNLPAHKNRQILKYFESAIAGRNGDKDPFNISTLGRKFEICDAVCKILSDDTKALNLNGQQNKFLEKLSEV